MFEFLMHPFWMTLAIVGAVSALLLWRGRTGDGDGDGDGDGFGSDPPESVSGDSGGDSGADSGGDSGGGGDGGGD